MDAARHRVLEPVTGSRAAGGAWEERGFWLVYPLPLSPAAGPGVHRGTRRNTALLPLVRLQQRVSALWPGDIASNAGKSCTQTVPPGSRKGAGAPRGNPSGMVTTRLLGIIGSQVPGAFPRYAVHRLDGGGSGRRSRGFCGVSPRQKTAT